MGRRKRYSEQYEEAPNTARIPHGNVIYDLVSLPWVYWASRLNRLKSQFIGKLPELGVRE